MAIVGYMGCGKSTVGRLLAHTLGWDFIGLDGEISRRENRIIPQIFAERGESYFRELEHRVLLDALNSRADRVVACGGGVILCPANRERLAAVSTVFLEEEPEVLYERTRDSSRPLRGADLQEFRRRYRDRLPRYREVAGLTVRVRRRPPAEIAEEIRRWLGS